MPHAGLCVCVCVCHCRWSARHLAARILTQKWLMQETKGGIQLHFRFRSSVTRVAKWVWVQLCKHICTCLGVYLDIHKHIASSLLAGARHWEATKLRQRQWVLDNSKGCELQNTKITAKLTVVWVTAAVVAALPLPLSMPLRRCDTDQL